MLRFCLGLALISRVAFAADLSKHPARSMVFWGPVKALSLEQKIKRKVPVELLDYIKQDNLDNGFSNVPKAATPSADFLADVKAAVQEIPVSARALIDKKLIGLFFVTDLGGSGYTESILDAAGAPVAAIVVLDIDALNKTANAWATWRENSPFAGQPQISAQIAAAAGDTRKGALQYILLHEFGHVVSVANPLLPPWGVAAKDLSIRPEMKFFNLSWKKDGDAFVSRFDTAWPERKKTAYYAIADKKLPDAMPVYRKFLETDFPTLYAASNPFDDWAESFANFVHVVLLKKPWQVTVESGGKTLVVKPCWSDARCRQKRALLEKLLGS